MKKDFVSLADLSPTGFWDLLTLAVHLKDEQKKGGNSPLLAGKTLGMIFQKPSLRTRVSFEVGMLQLGGHALYLSPNEIQLGVRESVPDVARVLSRFVDGIMARVFAHDDVVQLAKHAAVPVINGLSDYSHPCQGLADLLTVYEKLSALQGVRLVYVGDGNNVCTSLLFGGALAGMDVVACTPPGYEPQQAVVARAEAIAAGTGARISVEPNPHVAARGAHVLYTDVWASMGQESEAAARETVFHSYQLNRALVDSARPDVLVMHCLPAHRGHEITDEVIDGPHSVVLDQAENRLHAQKAVLAKLIGGASL